MFNNAALRENTFLKYLLPYMIINTSVMIVPIMWARTTVKLMLVTFFGCWSPSAKIRTNNFFANIYHWYTIIIASTSIPILVTQLTNVTTQYGMTSTENAYMWMCGFAGEAIARPIFGYLSRHFNVITLVKDLKCFDSWKFENHYVDPP